MGDLIQFDLKNCPTSGAFDCSHLLDFISYAPPARITYFILRGDLTTRHAPRVRNLIFEKVKSLPFPPLLGRVVVGHNIDRYIKYNNITYHVSFCPQP